MTEAILRVTDGTDVVDLIDPSSGFHLTSWVPQTADYKDGGIFQNPPLADFGQMVVGKWENVEESMVLTLNGIDPDTAARKLQDLRRLLQKANNYWITDWQNEPVWIEAKAKCETNTRYAIIQKGNLANDQNPYAEPFTGMTTTLTDLPFVFLRRHWTSDQPLQHTAIELSAVEAFNGRNFGNVDINRDREPTTEDEVFVANKQNIANLTHYYKFLSPSTWTANFIDTNFATPIVQSCNASIAYFGISTGVTDFGPFNNLIFDVITARSGGTIVIEYYNGSTWVAFGTITDNTSTFSNTGVNGIFWEQPSNWATANLNTLFGGSAPSVTAFWVRFRVTSALGTAPTFIPIFSYSTVWPYVEVQSTVVGGDISALLKNIFNGQVSSVSRIVMGTRLVSRGDSFRAFLNISDNQEYDGYAIGPNGPNATAIDYLSAPTGRAVQWAPPASTDQEIVAITMTNTLSSSYVGAFRVFLRFIPSSGSTLDWTLRLLVSVLTQQQEVTQSEVFVDGSLISDTVPNAIDMGVFRIPNRHLLSEQGTISISIEGVSSSSLTSETLTLIDLAFIPVDEWAIDTKLIDANAGSNIGTSNFLRLQNDGKFGVLSELVVDSTSLVIARYNSITNGYPSLIPNDRVRMWMMLFNSSTSLPYLAQIGLFLSIQSQVNQRYLTLRGDR